MKARMKIHETKCGPPRGMTVPEAEPAVAGDEPMVDADAQDTGAEIDAQDTDAEDVADEAEGFAGGPRDSSVLTEYAEHVAASVWFGEVHKLGRPVPTIEEMVARTGLSPLIACSVDTGDRGLICSFVERWHRETSTFHLPVGEVSIMLDDVASLLHLPIFGDFHTFQPLHIDEAVLMLVELLMISPEVAMDEIGHCAGPYVRLSGLRDIYQHRCQTQHWTAAAHALCDLTQTRRYAWGAAGLVHMYDQLNDVSISTNRQVAGYIMLLQCWIYQHFPSVAECNANLEYDEVSPHACRWIVTKKTIKKISTATYRQCVEHLRIPNVCWMPYAEHRLVQDFHPISCFS
ncbi:Protein MAIN-LIKE 1 [Glycine max]|nr:Protein MAIN-LIKE 1 [Glycine max]